MIADVGEHLEFAYLAFPDCCCCFWHCHFYCFCTSPLTAAAFPSLVLSNVWVKTRKYKQIHRNFLLLLGLILFSLWWHPVSEVFNLSMRNLIGASRKVACSSCHTTKHIEAAEILSQPLSCSSTSSFRVHWKRLLDLWLGLKKFHPSYVKDALKKERKGEPGLESIYC